MEHKPLKRRKINIVPNIVPNKKTRGRKSYWETKIKPRFLEIAAWCRDGYTDKLICEALSISSETFCKYKREKTELVEVLKINKQIADLTVENSLYKRAVGFSYEEITKETKTAADGNVISKHTKKVEKTVLPDVTAQIFWLKNRKQNEWRDRMDKTFSTEPISLNMNFGSKKE